MDWTPNKEIQTINSVELLLTQLSEAAKRHRADADSFHKKIFVLHSETLQVIWRQERLQQRHFSSQHY